MKKNTFIICWGDNGTVRRCEHKLSDKSLNEVCSIFENSVNNGEMGTGMNPLYIYAPSTDTLKVLSNSLFGYTFECNCPDNSSKVLPGKQYREFVDLLVTYQPESTALLRGEYASKKRLTDLYSFYEKAFKKSYESRGNGFVFTFDFLENLGIQSNIAVKIYESAELKEYKWYSVPFAQSQIWDDEVPVKLDNTSLLIAGADVEEVDTIYMLPFTGEDVDYESTVDSGTYAFVSAKKEDVLKRCIEFSPELIWSGKLSWFEF